MKRMVILFLFISLAIPAFADLSFQNSRPIGCYDTLTIHRVSGPVYVTNDKNNTYKDVTGIDRVGGAVAALYESDEPMSAKLKSKGLCEIYDYLPRF